jgi:hypothetical protein
MGLLVYLVFLLAGTELLRVGVWGVCRAGGWAHPLADPARQMFAARILAGALPAFAALVVGYGMFRALRPPEVTRLRLELPRLPAAMDGTTIVQITDVHLGGLLGRDWFERVIDRVNALEPDLVVITGDLVDGSVDSLRDAVSPLARLRPPLGTFFVTGNHEYYSGVDEWIRELERLGVRVLRNERVAVDRGGAGFDLAGVDDSSVHGMVAGHGPDLERALAGRDRSRALILLAHQPVEAPGAARNGVDLVLSGHTHGGQFWPWTLLVGLQQPYVRGLHRIGDTLVYVSDGTGFWGPPVRIGTRSEIVHVTLESPGGGDRSGGGGGHGAAPAAGGGAPGGGGK